MAKYLTRQGDTWDVIAYRFWGHETLMHTLLAANPQHADTLVFGADTELEIPSIIVPSKTLDLPPWFNA